MTLYDIALFVHMIGLIAMFGGFVLYARAGVRLRAARTLDDVRSWVGLLESSGPMFASGTVMLLLSGLYMMGSRWQAPHPWLVVPLTGLLTIWIAGATISARQVRGLRAAMANAHASISEELAARIADPFPWTVIAALNGLALGIVFVMSTKPGWTGSVMAVVVTTTVGSAIGARLTRAARYTVRAEPAEL